MTIAQVRAARKRRKQYRRENGPWPMDKAKSDRRQRLKVEGERLRTMRKKG